MFLHRLNFILDRFKFFLRHLTVITSIIRDYKQNLFSIILDKQAKKGNALFNIRFFYIFETSVYTYKILELFSFYTNTYIFIY